MVARANADANDRFAVLGEPLPEGLAIEAVDVDRHYSEDRKSPAKPLLVPVEPARVAEAARSHHATAVPSSSTIRPGTTSRVTPSIVVVGATPAAPNRDASTP